MVVKWMARAAGAAAECGTSDNASDHVEALNRVANGFRLQSDAMLRGGRVTKVAGQAASYSPDLGPAICGDALVEASDAVSALSPRTLLRWSAAPLALAVVLAIGAPEAAQAQAIPAECTVDITPISAASTITCTSTTPIVGAVDGLTIPSTPASIVVEDIESVTGSAGDGLDLASTGGDITVNAVNTITGTGGFGILALADAGNISIQGSGLVGGITGTGSGAFNTGGFFVGSGGGSAIAVASDGAVDIGGTSALGDLSSTNGYGIIALAKADITINTSAGSIASGNDGIRALNQGTGSVTITTADVTSRTQDAISVGNAIAADNVVVDSTAGSVSGGRSGIDVFHTGTGMLTIASGNVTANRGTGIDASNGFGTDIVIDSTAGSVTGSAFGIEAANTGTGAIRISTADVTGTNEDGIVADGFGTDIIIDSIAGTVTGGDTGINVDNLGSGLISITTADVTGTSGAGIQARNFGTDLLLDTSAGSIAGGTDGIDARNSGSGAVTIATAAVSGGRYGIRAVNNGDGALSVTSTGTVSGGSGFGILAYGGGTDVTVVATDTSGSTRGIFARNFGSGALTVTSTGTASGGSAEGIYANLRGTNAGTDLTISSMNAMGQDYGIFALNEGRGALSVTTTGTTNGTTADGIFARLEQDGTDLTIQSAQTRGGRHGIYARNMGAGMLSVVSGGAVSGGTATGIRALGSGTDLVIDSSGGSVSGGLAGIDASNTGTGALSITTADVTGTTRTGIAATSRRDVLFIGSTQGTVSGGTTGIDARQGLGGEIVITTADVSGGTDIGIRAYTEQGTSITIDSSAGAVSGGTIGIFADNLASSGAITVTTADVSGASGEGIYTRGQGTTTTIDSSAGTVTGDRHGIRARHEGSGALSITTAGVSGTQLDGINATSPFSSIVIDSSAGSVSGGQHGISTATTGANATSITVDQVTGGAAGIATASETGATTIQLSSTAVVTGNAAAGIDAQSTGGAISITGNSGAIIGATDGIAISSGGGAIVVDNLDSVTGNAGQGMFLQSAGGDISVTAVDTIIGNGFNGIRALSDGGDISVQGSGLVGGILGAGSVGIGVDSGEGAINLGGIAALGNITGGLTGVLAQNSNAATGDVIIDTSAGQVTAGNFGVFVFNFGSGAVSVTTADVTANVGSAVQVASRGSGLTIDTTAGRVSGGSQGVFASDVGTGQLTVSTGDVESTTGTAIIAVNGTASGDIVIDTSAGTVTGATSGIEVAQLGVGNTLVAADAVSGGTTGIMVDAGTGNLTLSLNGDVTGGDNGVVTITQNGTALTVAQGLTISGGSVGIATMAQGGSATSNDVIDIRGSVSGAVMTMEGDDLVTLADGATVNGTIMLGEGTDRFDYLGGTFGAARGGGGFDTLDFNSTGRQIDGSGSAVDAIAEFEVFNFNGGGFVLAGDHLGLTATNFNAGDNILLGSLASTGVTIAGGAGLEVADGALITGNLSNAGALGINAGGTGTFTIDGNFAQGAGSTLTLDVVDAASADALVVTGSADLAGTLAINQLQLQAQPVRLIDAGTGLGGSFDTITGLLPGGLLLSQAVEYDRAAFDVNLVTVVNNLSTITGLDDPDDLSIAPVLTSGFLAQSLGTLGNAALQIGLITDTGELSNALTELRPEIALSGLEVFRSSQTAFFQSLQGQGTSERGQSDGAGGVDAEPSAAPKGKQLWGSIRYMNHAKSGTGANPDFNADRFELATGLAGIRLGSITLDFAAGFANISTAQSGIAAPDKSDIEVFRLGANASINLNRSEVGLQARLDGTLAFATGSNDVDMTVSIPAAGIASTQSGTADITSIAAGLRLTLEGVGQAQWPVKPFVSFAWENLDTDDVSIGAGASALDTAGGNFDRTVVGYGLALSQQFGTSTTLRASAQADHYLGDTRIGLFSRLVEDSSGASTFLTTGEEIEEQYRLEFGLDQQLGNGWKMQIDAQAELGDLEGIGGTLTISKRF